MKQLSHVEKDALTGVVWRDDSQIVIELLQKVYADRPGCQVNIETIEDEPVKPCAVNSEKQTELYAP